MTWALLAAMAVFVAWHGDPIDFTQKQYWIEEAYTYRIYERYYTWADCGVTDYLKSNWYPIRECYRNTPERQDDFYIIFDIDNMSRERHRKTTLLWLYAQQRYESTK